MQSAAHFNARQVLGPVRWRLGLRRLERSALYGLTIGAATGAFLLLLGRAGLLPDTRAAALALVAAGTVAGALTSTRRWPGMVDAARAVDRHFALQDRMTTALELEAHQDPVARLQRGDVANRLPGLNLSESAHGIESSRSRFAAGLTLALLGALLLWGRSESRSSPVASAATDQSRIRHTALTDLPQVTRELRAGLTPQLRRDPTFRQLLMNLAHLQRQLLRTSSRSKALRAISTLQQQLQRSAASLHSVSRQSVGALNKSLGSYLARETHAQTSQGSSGADATAAQSLNQLATRTQHMSASQQAHLARALDRAVNSLTDARLRANLQRAASSLANGDTHAAQQALQQAARLVSGSNGARGAASRLGQANDRLDAAKNSISGIQAPPQQETRGSPSGVRQHTGQKQANSGARTAGKGSSRSTNDAGTLPSGAGRSPITGYSRGQAGRFGHGPVQGPNSSTGRPSAGIAAGQHGVQGPGKGHGSGSGGSGVGGHGSGGGQGGQGPHGSGKFVTVYVSGRQGQGPGATHAGSYGAPKQGVRVSYRQVLGQYTNSAHAALDHSNLPPSLRSYVRKYFTAISH